MASRLGVGIRRLLVLGCALAAGHAVGQDFHYVEPGVAGCPATPPSTAVARPSVARGVALRGRIHVACGFAQGSYTVTLNATDPAATFAPKTFLVNFGRLVGNGRYELRFATVGVHRVSATITSNMGSPPVPGQFVTAASEFEVVNP